MNDDDFTQILAGLTEAERVARGEDVGQRTYRWSTEDACWLATQYGVTAHGDTPGEASRELDEALALRQPSV